MKIDMNELIKRITAQVIAELHARGVQVVQQGAGLDHLQALRTKSEKIDMQKYRTPLLTEDHIRRLHELTGEIIIPSGTVITPKAREMVRKKQITITFETK